MVTINYRDSRPIYEQVKDSLRRQIITGAMPVGEKLPSVRELAGELAINPNTIQRAYRELEGEGYIASVPGKGSYVCNDAEAGAARRRELFRRFDEAVKELSFLGVTERELKNRISGRRQNEKDEHD